MGYLSPALSPLNPPTTVAERNWYPPQALSGLHYQVWTSSSSGYGGWRTYTEHKTERQAQAWAKHMKDRYPKEGWTTRQVLP